MLSVQNYYYFYENEILNNFNIELTYNFSKKDKDDIDELLKQLSKSQKDIDKDFEDLFIYKVGSRPVDEYLHDWKVNGYFLYVLRRNLKIIGLCLVHPTHKMLKNSILIHYLVINQSYRSKGFGKILLTGVLNDQRNKHPDKHFVINVFEQNKTAKKLYNSVGFKTGSNVMIKY